MPLRAPAFLLLLLALGAGLASCGRYQLGSGTEPRFSTLHVAVVQTEALVPQARALVTTALREAFIKDGRVRLVDTADEAEAVLTVVLTGYRRQVAVAQPADTGLARRFDVELSARATLADRHGTALFQDRPLTVQRGVFVDSGQSQAEYQILPLLAERLAVQTVRVVLDPW